MLHHTRGLVLRQTRYGETSLIVRIYTEAFGVQAYMVNGARSARSRTRSVLFQPPNLLDLVVYYTEGREIHRIKEARPLHVYERIPFHVSHSSVAIFMTEVLGKCLRDEHRQEGLFQFLEQRLLELDTCDQGLGTFPALFLLGLSRHLGFQPQGRFGEQTPWFDLQEGIFVSSKPDSGYALLPEESAALDRLLQHEATLPETSNQPSTALLPDPEPLLIPGPLRQSLLESLLIYYRYHIEGFGIMRSPAILHEVLSKER